MARRFGRSSTEAEPRRAPLKVLRADGRRIDLKARDSAQLLTQLRAGSSWQTTAFGYRDLIGELRYANKLLARSVARVRFYVAQERPWPQEPAPLDGDDHTADPQLAADAKANFDWLPLDANPDGFTARIVENLAIAGETWVHVDEQDIFHVRSVSEVSASSDGKVMVNELPGGAAGSAAGARQINPDTEDLVRLWLPHPQWAQLADSPLRSLLDVAEDAVLAGREQRAAARSRLAANGILLIPDSLSLATTREDQDEDEDLTDTFMQDLTEALIAPISDDGDPGSVVPITIRGDADDIDKVRHITLTRADSDQLIERQSTALLRLLQGLDVQPEQVTGAGASNHWTGWLIEASSVKHQVTPMAESVAACLTQGILRPALLSLGHDAAKVAEVTIAVDVSPLTENPNRGADARDAHAAFVLSDDALLRALGFEEDDKPDDAEVVKRMARAGNLPPELMARVLGFPEPAVQGQDAVGQGQTEAPRELPAASPGQTVPTNPVPVEPADPTAPPITAAAAVSDDGWRVAVATELADVDQRLADRLQVACDDAIARVLERAGARVRSQAQKDKALTAAVAGLDAHLVPGRLGRERVESFASISDLLADGYRRLRAQFTGWLGEAAVEVADTLIRLLGLEPSSRRAQRLREAAEARLTARADMAWGMLADTLDEAAARVMFEPDPFNPRYPDEEGHEPSVPGRIVQPREIENVLRAAGGGNPLPTQPGRGETVRRAPMLDTTPGPGGFGTGPDVSALLAEQGGVLLGWEWQYRPQIRRRQPFAPYHTRLNGVRFATFTDPVLDTEAATAWIGPFYYPGDHTFCSCRVVPVLACPELDDDTGGDIVAQRLREAAESDHGRAAARVAAEDTAAGRVATSLQMEVEVRDRLRAEVDRLREQHIGGRG